MSKPWGTLGIGVVIGAIVTTLIWKSSASGGAVTKEVSVAVEQNDAVLKTANANLTASLQECDRKLQELERSKRMPETAAAEPANADPTRPGPRRGPLSADDWTRMAEHGVVPVRIPCLRDKPWSPPDRVVTQLGLSPGDIDVIKQAYESSNKRVAEQVKPLCVQALGSDAADKIGTSGCIDAISNTARRTNAAQTKAALTRVAEVKAGTREAPKPGTDVLPVEQLGHILTKEARAYVEDLVQRLGPEEGRRIARAPEMCTEFKVLQSEEIDLPALMRGAGGPPRP